MRRATLLLCLIASPAAGAAVRYVVTPDAGLASASVEVCVARASAAQVFHAADARADDYVAGVGASDGRTFALVEGRVSAGRWRAGECLAYRVDLAALGAARRSGLGWNVGGDLLLSPHAWLLRPRGLARNPQATIDFVLPAGVAVSAPWTSLDAAPPRRRFRLGTTPPDWPALVALGRFQEQDIAAGAGSLRLAITGAPAPEAAARLTRYAATAAADFAAVFPHGLAGAPQLVMIPIGTAREPVPFGQSYRGGAPAINLFVDPARGAREYLGSWTLHHELVHLLHPYLGAEGRWISEGLATWFQHVLRVRAGHQSEAEAWEEIDAGFERGRRDVSGLSLRDTSARVESGRHYMRAYWSGTALMLLAELGYREASGGRMTLARALARHAECCRDPGYRQDPRAFLAAVDRAAGHAVLVPLWQRHADQHGFPDLAPAYAALGIRRAGGALALDPGARHATLRAALLHAPTASASDRVTS